MPFLGGEMVFEFMADAFFCMLGVLCWTTTAVIVICGLAGIIRTIKK